MENICTQLLTDSCSTDCFFLSYIKSICLPVVQKYFYSRMKETTTIKYKSKIPMKAHCMCVFFLCSVQGLYKKSRGLLGLEGMEKDMM